MAKVAKAKNSHFGLKEACHRKFYKTKVAGHPQKLGDWVRSDPASEVV
jgi:hypothetical protein